MPKTNPDEQAFPSDMDDGMTKREEASLRIMCAVLPAILGDNAYTVVPKVERLAFAAQVGIKGAELWIDQLNQDK